MRKPTIPLEMTTALDNGPTDKELGEEDLRTTTIDPTVDEEAFKKEMLEKREKRETRIREGAKKFISDLVGFVRTSKEPEAEREDGVGGKTEANFLKSMKRLKCTDALERKVRRGID